VQSWGFVRSFTLVTHFYLVFKFMILQSWFENWVWFHITILQGHHL
jgi:hypothetical protein